MKLVLVIDKMVIKMYSIDIEDRIDRMRKVKSFLLENIKTIVAFILGIVISGGTVYAATILFSSNQVVYTNNGQSTVQSALNELYTRTNSLMNLNSIELYKIFTANNRKTIFANSKGLCVYRNNKLNCFKVNSYPTEESHMRQVFSDASCSYSGTSSKPVLNCDASDFACNVSSVGFVRCTDKSNNSFCYVGGSITTATCT